MRRLTAPMRAARGFTMIETMVTLCIAAVLLGVGVPRMSDWLATNRAAGVLEFYTDGLRQARQQALSHNSASRLRLVEHAATGQYDWQIDICFPSPAEPCNDDVGEWSTPAAPASNDPAGATGYRSILRSASALPNTDSVTVALSPAGADQVYFTALGWTDQNVAPRLTRLTVAPTQPGLFRSSAVALTLAGLATKCEPASGSGDSRQCPP